MHIAVVGLGTMGTPMARHLLRSGHSLSVHNRTRSKEEPLVSLGACRAATPAEASAHAEVLLICVSDTPDVEAVLFDPQHGAASQLKAGTLVIDCSTISPKATQRFAATLSESGIGLVDAPVSGGSEGAEKGTLAIMCGGTDEDFRRAHPLLSAFGRSITHVGPSGFGQIAKAVNQVLIAGTYQSLAEGLSLAKSCGADPRRVLEAVSGGAARSWVLENRAGNMIADSYPLGFRMRLHRKDLGIALETARDRGADLPLTHLVAKAEDLLIQSGFGDEDVSALARAVRRAAGIPDGPI